MIKEQEWKKKLVVKMMGLIYVLFVVFFGLWGIFIQHNKLSVPYADYNLFTELLSAIPESDKNSFVAYSVDPSVYLIGDILPCYRYSNFQDDLMAIDESFYEKVYEEFLSLQAKWILVKKKERISNSRISPILIRHYLPMIKKKQYVLYKLKE